MDFAQWLALKNYTYQGDCGCKANKRVYDNKTGWQVWVSMDGNRIEFRQVYGRDSILRGVADLGNFERIYEYNINKYKYEMR